MKLKLVIILTLVNLYFNQSKAQTIDVKRIDPSNWWVGMKNSKLQVLLYGKNIAECSVALNYPGITLERVIKVENPNYLFIDLNINTNTQAGTLYFNLKKTFPVIKKGKVIGGNEVTQSFPFAIKSREKAQPKAQGLTQADLVYLVLPDRFSNADPSNDKFDDMADKESDRKNPFLRHGGDLKGIQNHLDYVEELGATALWLNPVTENDQPTTNEGGTMRSAYHGYGFTDHYKVDRRLGGNDAYLELVNKAHARGIKIMQDIVYNHIGKNHWWMNDMPAKDFLNQWDVYQNTSYKDQPVIDPHQSLYDRKVAQEGWFVPFLPDLNQKNPLVANYLIQNAIWYVEYFGIDAYRIDTYFYNDLDFMNRCNQALTDEYPKIFITGENSVNSVVSQAYLSKNVLNVPFKSNLMSANDFVLMNAINEALTGGMGWGKGFDKIYQTLAQDILYYDPTTTLTFVDNHDQDRFYSIIGENYQKYKMGITLLLTTRGIPQIYYGTEILTKNFKNPSDAEVRKDFEGGWPEDAQNKFLASGRTPKENEAFGFFKTLCSFRKNSDAIANGKLMQFTPYDGLYCYFRYSEKQTVMILLNQNETEKKVDTARFNEKLQGFKKGKEIISGTEINDLKTISIPAMSAMVIELK